MKKNLLILPVSLPFFIFLLGLPFLILAILSLLEVSAAAALRRTLGLPVLESVALYLTILIASTVNLPLYEFKSTKDSEQKYVSYMGMKYPLPVWHGHNTVVSVNLGGCILSILVSAYFALSLQLLPLLLSTIIVSLGVFLFTKPSRSTGFYVPAAVPPLLSLSVALLALYLYNGGLYNCARMAFAAGSVGTLLGTNVLNIPRLHRLGTSSINIGGLGSFDGIFLTGVLSTVVACIFASV